MQPDVERVEREAARIRERIASIYGAPDLDGGKGAERAIDEAARLARVTAHWGIASSWPVGGAFEVLAKRVMRILARWYVNPIVEQQNEFNAAVLRSLYELAAELDALRAQLRLSQQRGEHPGREST